MRRVIFHPDERDLFRHVYMGFVGSQKAPNNMEEASTALEIVTKLKNISHVPEDAKEGSVLRELNGEGGEIRLEEVEFKYLQLAIYPPNSRWSHQGMEILHSIKVKFDAAEKE